jgi:hypothetical protein
MPQAYEGHNFHHALEVIILVASIISFLVSAAIIVYIAYNYKSGEKIDAQLIIRRSSLSSSSSSGKLGIIKPGEDESVIEISEHLSFSKHPKTVQERRQLFLALSDLQSRKITTIREERDDGDEENEEEDSGELPSVHSSYSSSPSIRYVDGHLVVRKKRNLGDTNELNGEDMLTIPGLSKSSSASSYISQQSLNTPSSSCSSIRSTKRKGKYPKYRPNFHLTPQYLHLLSLQLLQQNQSPMNRHFPPQVYCKDLSAEDEKEEEERMRILLQSKETLFDPATRPSDCTSTFPDICLPDEELYDV